MIRLQAAASSAIVGSWYAIDKSGSLLFTFLSNGTYLLKDTGDSAADPSGHSGMELGTYTWDAGTGALAHKTLIDTDGEWGLSHAIVSSIKVSGGTLTMSLVGEDEVSLTKVAANTITGTSGNDQMRSTASNDVVDGDTGLDSYVLNGVRHDFTITQTPIAYTCLLYTSRCV